MIYDEHHHRRPERLSAPLVNLVRVTERVQVFPDLLKYASPDVPLPLEWMQQRLAKTEMITPAMFLQMPHLRHVSLHGGCGGRLDEVPQVELPQLESLALYDPGIGLMKVFRVMRYVGTRALYWHDRLTLCGGSLPRLRELCFRPSDTIVAPVLEFVKVHGTKITTLTIDSDRNLESYKQPIFDWCPNLVELRLTNRLPVRT